MKESSGEGSTKLKETKRAPQFGGCAQQSAQLLDIHACSLPLQGPCTCATNSCHLLKLLIGEQQLLFFFLSFILNSAKMMQAKLLRKLFGTEIFLNFSSAMMVEVNTN